ncbi:hypothetical protein K2X14_06125 [Acetobacter sp. TBRC 12305]|uniref:Uncharacterized protein n=1 Tax=Acetobacter garciniae TaxID=2817435 RepID=A0A939HP87_9PROT|nr:hypothetical protein [Acetobacter garciniae]MBO1324724.1 hypothetical protein [Acetobacter garciniae]MBX0344415.1 hypothetical protein [Acetobacter garciniae]
MKKNVLFMVCGIGLLGGIGWLGTRHAEHVMLDTGLAHFKEALGPDASLTYAKARPGLLGRSLEFTNLVFRQGPETITADTAELTKPDTNEDGASHIRHLSFRNFQLADPSGSLRLDRLDMDNVILPARMTDGSTYDGPQAAAAQSISIGKAQASRLHGFVSSLQSDISATTLTMTDFGAGEFSHLQADNVALATDDAASRHVTAKTITVDGVDLAGLYRNLSDGTPYTPLTGGRDIDIRQLAISGPTPLLRIEHLLSHANRTATAETEVSSAQGLELWPSIPNLGWLTLLGYDHFHGALVLNDTHDLKTGGLHVDELSLDSPDMGHMHLHGDFSQASSTSVLTSASPDMQVIALTLTYVDHGLVPKALQAIATAQGTTVQAVLASLRGPAPQAAAPAPPPPAPEPAKGRKGKKGRHAALPAPPPADVPQATPAAPQPPTALDHIVDFLTHPENGPLELDVHPPQPLPLFGVIAAIGAVGTTPEMAERIGLSVR